jgi:hypothetical protein
MLDGLATFLQTMHDTFLAGAGGCTGFGESITKGASFFA